MALAAPSPVRVLARPDAGWSFSLYPDALEGGGSFAASTRRVPEYVERGAAKDPDRAVAEAGRRAQAKLRRYCAANQLSRLGALTYRPPGCHDPAEVRAHLGLFFRRLRDLTGGAALPYVWVPEWHKSGHGLHVHFALGKYVRRALIDEAWGRGFVHIKLLGDLPSGAGSLTHARVAARYLSKYVAKTFTDPSARVLGMHRYDVAQGFAPRVVHLSGRSAAAVIAQASELLSGVPSKRWDSNESEQWEGPPAVWAQWGR